MNAPARLRILALRSFGALALAALVFILYRDAIGTGFFGSDFEFLPVPALLGPVAYLNRYFNPYLQNMWFHPYQGLQWGLEYIWFGNNAAAYHWIQLLQHVINAWLVYALVGTITRQWRAAFVAAFIWAGLPTYNLSVLWPANPDPLVALFMLSTIYLWWLYLKAGRSRYFVAAFLAFLSAILSKEIAATLPFLLLLLDRLIGMRPVSKAQLAKRYVLFFLTLIPYFVIEYIVQTRSLFTQQFGWSIGTHIITNALYFFQQLFFPWGIREPWTIIILGAGVIAIGYWIVTRKAWSLLFLVSFCILTLGPIIPFPSFLYPRYLYSPLIASAIVFAFIWIRAWDLSPSPLLRAALITLIACLAFYNSTLIADAAADFGGLARVNRLPFRDFSQRHPTLDSGTYLFFINPPTPTRELFAMFLARYGNNVVTAGSDLSPTADLRSYPRSIVIYYDGDTQKEQQVDSFAQFRVTPTLPAQSSIPIRLDNYEIANPRLKRGDSLILILYWLATGAPNQNYSVFAHVENGSGELIASQDNSPSVPTSSLMNGRQIADYRVIKIPKTAPLGSDYRVKVGWYDPSSLARLPIIDVLGHPIADSVSIGALSVVE